MHLTSIYVFDCDTCFYTCNKYNERSAGFNVHWIKFFLLAFSVAVRIVPIENTDSV